LTETLDDKTICFENEMRTDLFDMSNVRDFKGRDVLRVTDFTRDEIMYYLEVGRIIAQEVRDNRDDLTGTRFNEIARGKRGALTFFEPSTRTFDSSLVAMTNLGIPNPVQRRSSEGTSQKKSEALAHDLMMYSVYNSHVIVMRHPCEGSPQWAADYVEEMARRHNKVRPIIVNGGDGSHSHVTQALLDSLGYYTHYFVGFDGKDLCRELNPDTVMSGITLYGIGDSLKGRTIKDNARLLAKFKNNRLVLVGPPVIRMLKHDIKDLERSGLDVEVLENIPDALLHMKDEKRPIGYFLRTQEERLDSRVVESVRDAVSLKPADVEKKGLLVLDDEERGSKLIVPWYHPLPMHRQFREIDPVFERTPHFKCFDEAEMGPYMRTGIIGLGLGVITTSSKTPYVDPRIPPDDYPTFEKEPLRADIGNGKDDFDDMFQAMQQVISDDIGQRLFDVFAEAVAKGQDPRQAYNAFLDELANHEELQAKYRHLTFRFVKGEDGTVIDHVGNGLTGLIKYQLDLSSYIDTKGCDGKPMVVSAVDGLKSAKHGLKGVIKVRGLLLPPEDLHYCKLLSDDIRMAHVKDGSVVAKYVPTTPRMLVNFIRCKNSDCMSGEEFSEKMDITFYRDPDRGDTYRCRNCDTPVHRREMRPLLLRGG
jgi:aspartate carbamoyltransferase catalytic subunit/aspartate carbamoyltransferase regulatory subunit